MTPDLTIYFDGLCEPNPGGVSTVGWYILDHNGEELAAGHRVVRQGGAQSTNNFAEWCALGCALRWLHDHAMDACYGSTLVIHGDSQLVCNQLVMQRDCKAEHLRKLRDRCLDILARLRLKEWFTQWVPRERNERADELSRRAYVECTGREPPERRKG